MDITGCIGKKVDIICHDGEAYAGFVFEHSLPEDSDIGEDSITLAPLGKDFQLEIATKDIASIRLDQKFISFD